MTNLAQWSLIVAFFVPIVVAFVTQKHWPSWIKSVTMLVVSLLAAAGTAYFQGDFTGKRFLDSALIVVAAAIAYYHGIWKPTTVAPVIEEKTTITPAPTG